MFHFLTTGTINTVAALITVGSAVLGFAVALRGFPRFLAWFKRREQLMAERNVAIARFEDSKSSIRDLKDSLEIVRRMNVDTSERLKQLEDMRPIYDAAMMWTPLAFEFVTYVSLVAKEAKIDLGGRLPPEMPAILLEHITQQARSMRFHKGDAPHDA